MKRKIYWNMCLVALFSMILATFLTAGLLIRDLKKQMERAVATEVRYLESAMESSGEDFLVRLDSRGDGGSINRITWVAADGTVLYDSFADPEGLPNHKNRPEVEKALEMGRGQSTRLSDTLAEQTYYYAARLPDGTVIRVGSTTRSSIATMIHTIPWMVVMAAAIFCVTMVVAERQTRRIVEPINRLDPEAPQKEPVYDELAPLVLRLERQKATILEQMDTLQKKQQEFAAITENMSEGFIVVDRKADVISYNSSALRILGVEQGPEKNAEVNILNFNRSGGFRQVVDEALDGRRSERLLELGGRSYQIIANPVEEAGEAKGAVVVILDVTEQESRESLRREFSANVSHELKTPLTSIQGYAEIMKDGLARPEDMRGFADKIYTEARRLITLVGDIIRLSRLDEGLSEPEKSPVDLYVRASEVVRQMGDEARRRNVTVELSGGSAVVCGVVQVLDEMIYNLCDNAIKYNKPGGHVKIAVEMQNGRPVLSVADDGIGIPESEKERVFERFYRVDKSHSKQIGGTGLGLSIVKHGAACHGAQVELESALGRGTRVTVRF